MSIAFIEKASRFIPVGIKQESQPVKATLQIGDILIDVTSNHTIASLHPLFIAISFQSALLEKQDLLKTKTILSFHETISQGRFLGDLVLRYDHVLLFEDISIYIFRITKFTNQCVSAFAQKTNHAMLSWRNFRYTSPRGLKMSPMEIQALSVMYFKPRRVMLVTTGMESGCNLFPMDLLGNLHPSYFSLALRLTSPALDAIKKTKKIAMSFIDSKYFKTAYELGKHHINPIVDWNTLPFRPIPSPTLNLPIPEVALGVRELSVEAFFETGSHQLMLASLLFDQHFSNGETLHHINASYQDVLKKDNRHYPEAR